MFSNEEYRFGSAAWSDHRALNRARLLGKKGLQVGYVDCLTSALNLGLEQRGGYDLHFSEDSLEATVAKPIPMERDQKKNKTARAGSRVIRRLDWRPHEFIAPTPE